MTAPLFLEVGPNGHVRQISDSGPVQAGITELVAFSQSRTDSRGRTVWNTHDVSTNMLRQHFDSTLADLRERGRGIRSDSFSASMGSFNPRDLTQRMTSVLEERHAPLSARRVFPLNTELRPGSRNYEQWRVYTGGEASVYRGGQAAEKGEIEVGQGSFTAPIIYFISSFSVDWLEQLAINLTGFNTQLRKMRGARRALEEIENRFAFTGSVFWKIYGLLSHPYVDTLISDVAFNSGSSATAISRALSSWANYAEQESHSTFQPDTMLIATDLLNYIANEKFGGGDPDTVLDHFKRAHPHIKKIEKVPELNGAGPGGTHGIFFCRGGMGPGDSSVELMQVLPITILPPERRSLTTKTHLVSGFGGLSQHEVGDNLLVWVEGP